MCITRDTSVPNGSLIRLIEHKCKHIYISVYIYISGEELNYGRTSFNWWWSRSMLTYIKKWRNLGIWPAVTKKDRTVIEKKCYDFWPLYRIIFRAREEVEILLVPDTRWAIKEIEITRNNNRMETATVLNTTKYIKHISPSILPYYTRGIASALCVMKRVNRAVISKEEAFISLCFVQSEMQMKMFLAIHQYVLIIYLINVYIYIYIVIWNLDYCHSFNLIFPL